MELDLQEYIQSILLFPHNILPANSLQLESQVFMIVVHPLLQICLLIHPDLFM